AGRGPGGRTLSNVMTFSSDDLGAHHPERAAAARVVDIDAWRGRRAREQQIDDLTRRFHSRVRGFLAGLGVSDPDDGANEVLSRAAGRPAGLLGGAKGTTR